MLEGLYSIVGFYPKATFYPLKGPEHQETWGESQKIKQKWNNIFPLIDTCKGINLCTYRHISTDIPLIPKYSWKDSNVDYKKKKKIWKTASERVFSHSGMKHQG